METSKQEYWTTVFRREQLLELLEGRGPRPKKDNRLLALGSCANADLVGIWTTARTMAFSPLPQVITGTHECLDDLFAWSGSYLRELGPLSGLVRTVSLEQLNSALIRKPPQELWEIAGAAVGIVVGEVWCRSGSRISLEEAATATPSSTLAYAMMRSWALGYRAENTREVFDKYVKVSQLLGHPLQNDIGRSVFHVVNTVVGASEDQEAARVRNSVTSRWWELLRGGVSVYDLLAEVLQYPKDLFGAGSIEEIKEKTAEERVRFFDLVAPTLVNKHDRIEERGAAFALALAAFVCRPGFFQQATLLREHAEKLPETILWLGAFQVLSPLSDSLLLQSGAGWRIARELDRAGDVFSAPIGDGSVAEVEKLSRVKSRGFLGLVEKSRVDIEIYPMIVSTFRGAKDNASVSRLGEKEYVENMLMENRMYMEKLDLLEVQLHEALHIVRNVRNASVGKDDRRGRGRKR